MQMSKKETVRVQMELPPQAIERLKTLKTKTEASSYAEVTKNAYRLYDMLIELHEQGNSLLLKDETGKTQALRIFI